MNEDEKRTDDNSGSDPPPRTRRTPRIRPSFTAAEIESRYQEHQKRITEGGKCNAR